MDKYILNDRGEPQVEPDLRRWEEWFEVMANRRVALDVIEGVRVSTVFLGLDHNFGAGKPVLWETMIFLEKGIGGLSELRETQWRYSSQEAAAGGHILAVEMVREALDRLHQRDLLDKKREV